MSLNSGSFDEELYEARKQEAIRQAQEMVQNAQEWDEPISDEEFKKLAEENLKNERDSLKWWQLVKQAKMYAWREKLLAEEIQRLKNESHKENLEQANDLLTKLNEWENEWKPKINIQVDSDRSPVFLNTFRKK